MFQPIYSHFPIQTLSTIPLEHFLSSLYRAICSSPFIRIFLSKPLAQFLWTISSPLFIGPFGDTNKKHLYLVNLRVNVYNNLWPGYENNFGRSWCQVAARCCREFRHPDGSRCLTYLIEHNGAYFPIKHSGLLDCISQQVRRTLPAQRP